MKNSFPLVYIIILNYNGFADTIECLESIDRITYKNYKIVIVDNNSTDDSENKIIDWFQARKKDYTYLTIDKIETKSDKKFSLIQSGGNKGFGAGNNIGIKYALLNETNYVLILNNDTVVENNFLQPLVKICETDKSIGVVSSKIYYYDKPNAIWFNGGKFNRYTARIKHINYKENDIGQVTFENSTFVSGCSWLSPSFIFTEIGLFNEKYFMYVEDVEFSQRIRNAGYKLKVSDESIIYHKVKEISAFSTYWGTKNWILYIKDNMPLYTYPFAFFNSIIRLTFRLFITKNYKMILYQFKGIKDGFFNNGGNI